MSRSGNGDCHRNCRVLLRVCAMALVLGAGSAARADDSLIDARGQVSLGSFLNNSELKIRVDGESSEGTRVDWGNTFGDEDVTRFRLDGLWRVNDRHHVRVLFTDYSSSQTETIEQDIEWQGDTFPIGAEVHGKQSFTIIEAAYEYAFIRSDSYELAGSIGLHYTTFEATLRADVPAPGGGGTVSLGGPAKVDAPLPVVGAHGMWRMSGNFYFDAQAQFFKLSFDGYDGNIVNYRAAFTWQPKRSVGIGLGYDNFTIDMDVDKANFEGSMDWTYSGPQAFFNLSF